MGGVSFAVSGDHGLGDAGRCGAKAIGAADEQQAGHRGEELVAEADQKAAGGVAALDGGLDRVGGGKGTKGVRHAAPACACFRAARIRARAAAWARSSSVQTLRDE